MMNRNLLTTVTALGSILAVTAWASLTTPHADQPHPTVIAASPSIPTSEQLQTLTKIAPDLNPKILKLALHAYNKAKAEGLVKKQILSVVDYSQPDTKKSLWVFDLKNNKLLFHTLVAHGSHSGNLYATHFSNEPTTKESSLGLYVTGKTFYGNDGYSLRLHGLSKGFNTNAYRRDIVVHGAWYVSKKFVKNNHRLGRSWGCLALSKKMVRPVINTIKSGSLIFAYADNKHWLKHGPYVSE